MSFRQPLSPVTNALSTPKRPTIKSVSPSTSKALVIRSPLSAVATFTDQDENKQKKERRRVSQVFDLLCKPPGSPNTSSPRQTDALNGLSNAQLSTHYADCIKLSAENKINSKNAFGLHLIDYMTELVKKKDLESFQVASSTLDASVKIYAGRVDFIHTHTYKVLSGLGGGKTGNATGYEEADEEKHSEATIKAEKKRKGKEHTIESKLKNINLENVDLEFEVDPMFQIMSTAFDEGGARGLLLNRLQSFDRTQHLILDSSTVLNVVEDILPNSQDSKEPVSVSDVKGMLEKLNLEERKICPSSGSFHFADLDGNTSMFPKEASAFAFDAAAEPKYVPNIEEDVENFASEEVTDCCEIDNGIQETSHNSEASSFGTGDMRMAAFVESAFSDLTNGNAGKLRQILALEPSDYSYFNKILRRTWAGSAHWRVIPATRNGTGPSEEKAQRKHQRKAPLVLTFDTPIQALDSMFQPSKSTIVTPATWAKYAKKKTTLPMDKQMDTQDSLFRLFEKPKYMIQRQAHDCIGFDDNIESYDYNNKNDVDNYCPVARDVDDTDSDSIAGFDLSNEISFPQASQKSHDDLSEHSLSSTSITQDRLISAPHRVERIDVKYATTAKQVDVKRLKTALWNILAEDKKDIGDMASVPNEEHKKMVLSSNFKILNDQLPQKISSIMAKNLTVQTVFACLLYITNEKVLSLTSSGTMDDIVIAQDIDNN